MLRITSVEPLDGYRLRVAFNDGVERDVDCAFLLRGALGEPCGIPRTSGRSGWMRRRERWCGPTALIQRRSFCMATTVQRSRTGRTPQCRPSAELLSGARNLGNDPCPPS